jgi:ribosome-associated protein
MSALVISPFFRIPLHELELSYVRSSGPGGQNVNKVSSKCQLRWNAIGSPSIPSHFRERVLQKIGPRLTTEGDLIVSSDLHRDQGRNREDCLEKLRCILAEAIVVPKMRKATKPTHGSQKRREGSKRVHSQKKRLRGRVRSD